MAIYFDKHNILCLGKDKLPLVFSEKEKRLFIDKGLMEHLKQLLKNKHQYVEDGIDPVILAKDETSYRLSILNSFIKKFKIP